MSPPSPDGSQALWAQLDADQKLVAAGRLHPDCAATLHPCDGPPRAVVLLLHGFTAGPWQFRDLCAQLGREGLIGYAARLPGHGATEAGAFSSAQLPKSAQADHFGRCADAALDAAHAHAQALQVPLYLVGFSAGGALVADLILRRPHPIARAALIAPFLCPLGRHRRIFFRLAHALPGGGRLMDRVAFAWKPSPARTDAWVRPGHSAFHLGNLVALFSYAAGLGQPQKPAGLPRWPRRRVRPLARGWRIPTQIILSATDDKVDARALRRLVKHWPKPPHVWWFSPHEAVPHAMLSPEENANPATRAQIAQVLTRFLRDGVGASNS